MSDRKLSEVLEIRDGEVKSRFHLEPKESAVPPWDRMLQAMRDQKAAEAEESILRAAEALKQMNERGV